MSRESSDRARRLAARPLVKRAQEALRPLGKVLAEIERLEGLDTVGVVKIEAGEAEASYGADVLDIVAQALQGAGHDQVVEVFVTVSAADQIPNQRHRSWIAEKPRDTSRR